MKFTILTAIAVSVSMVHAQEVEKKNTDRLEPSSKVVVKESKGNVVALKKTVAKSAGEAGLKIKSSETGSQKQSKLNGVLKACAADAKARMKERSNLEIEQGTQCLSEMEGKRKGGLVRELALYCLEQKKTGGLDDAQISKRMDDKFKESYGKVFRGECLDKEVNAFHKNGGKKRAIAAKEANPAPTVNRKERAVVVMPTKAPKAPKAEVEAQETYETQAALNEDGAEAAN